MENDGVPQDQRALTFSARFLNIFVDYPLGQMRVGDKLWMNWNKAPMRLWQTQLNTDFFSNWLLSALNSICLPPFVLFSL